MTRTALIVCLLASVIAAGAPALAQSPERIVYSSLRPGNWDVFLFERPGVSPRRLTESPGLDYGAELSPDGRWIVFTSERRGNPDLYVIDTRDLDAAPRLLVDSPELEDQATISPDGRTIAFVGTRDGNADIFTMPFDPARTQRLDGATNLTRHAGGDFRPAYSPDGTRIAFTTDRDTPVYGHPFFSFTRQREGEIYVMDADGGNPKRLTRSPDWDGSAEWSADGATIYFYSARPRETPGPPTSPIIGQEGGFRIWAMNADGSGARAITPGGTEALAPRLTPDGRLAFQTREGYARWHIASVALDGTDLRNESGTATDYWEPDYSPAGAMVAHGVGPNLAHSQAVEAVLGAGALLSADYPQTVEIPGRTLALYPMRHTTGLAPHPYRNEVVATIEDEAGSRLVLADFRGASERELFYAAGIGIASGSPNRLFDIKYSSDGDSIVYSSGAFAGGATDQADIWIMRRDGSARRNVTRSNDNDGVAAFSPDGSRIVFRSARDGNFELYTMGVDGTRVQRLTNNPARDNFPVYSPSSDAIAFSSDRDSELDRLGFRTFDNYLLELDADGMPGAVRRLSTDRGQDAHPWFSPDGEWIVYTSERAGISDEEPLVQEIVFGPQMYGEIFAQRLRDGLSVRLTHNKWEEGNPFWLAPERR